MTTLARTTTFGMDLKRYAPFCHLDGFRSYPLLACYAPGHPACGGTHVDVKHSNPDCGQPHPLVIRTAMAKDKGHLHASSMRR